MWVPAHAFRGSSSQCLGVPPLSFSGAGGPGRVQTCVPGRGSASVSPGDSGLPLHVLWPLSPYRGEQESMAEASCQTELPSQFSGSGRCLTLVHTGHLLPPADSHVPTPGLTGHLVPCGAPVLSLTAPPTPHGPGSRDGCKTWQWLKGALSREGYGAALKGELPDPENLWLGRGHTSQAEMRFSLSCGRPGVTHTFLLRN